MCYQMLPFLMNASTEMLLLFYTEYTFILN